MTDATMLPDPSAPPRPRAGLDIRDPHVRRVLRLLGGVALLAYSMVMLTLVPLPFITISPGSATDVLDLIDVDGASTYEPEGKLLFLTVSLSQRITVIEALAAWSENGVEIIKEEVFTGNVDRDEVIRRNLLDMQRAEVTAVAVALTHLGFEIRTLGGGARVVGVVARLPAEGILQEEDVITAVDGKAVVFRSDAIEAVRAHAPGESVQVSFRRGDEDHTAEIATVKNTEGFAQVGVNLAETFEFAFPFDVDIDTGQVGGPSAGLAFTLAIIDELTPGELTGGDVVAITGAIELDGSVTPVGGVEQKAAAARNAGAKLMIVPKGEAQAARSVVGTRMNVVEVTNLQEALDALAEHGGDALALPASPSDPSTAAPAPAP
ncbi:MAG TPA: S16 family serine protease [Acidimicrobiia bacterium]|nr:S16 family serine protease [Acidimicrobiia bacterium]